MRRELRGQRLVEQLCQRALQVRRNRWFESKCRIERLEVFRRLERECFIDRCVLAGSDPEGELQRTSEPFFERVSLAVEHTLRRLAFDRTEVLRMRLQPISAQEILEPDIEAKTL